MAYEIVALKQNQSALVGQVAKDGFIEDPVNNWVFNHSPELIERYFSLVARETYLKHGFGSTTNKGEGVTLWLPPNKAKNPDLLTNLKSLALMAQLGGLTSVKRGMVFDKLVGARKPAEPFYYLYLIVCQRAQQGKGLGAQLIEPTLHEIASKGATAYLESSNENNLSFYKRYGFEILDEVKLGNSGPSVWLMQRTYKKVTRVI